MQYKISGTTVPCVEITLGGNESVYTQSGAMAWMDDGIEMDTNTRGGVLKGISRMFAGESMFQSIYTARRPDAHITFASTVPGSIVACDLAGMPDIICQKGAFLCAQPSVNLDVVFTKRFSAGLFGGEGFILQKLSGRGIAFLEVDGDAVERVLAPGEVLKVDTGNIVAFESTVSYDIETVKGIKNVVFGGEGLFLTKLTGPGRVILQTMSFENFAQRIIMRIPTSNK